MPKIKAETEHAVHHYEINVARLRKSQRGTNYEHFFATNERSIKSLQELNAVLLVLREKFPMPEFQVSVTAHFKYGEAVAV